MIKQMVKIKKIKFNLCTLDSNRIVHPAYRTRHHSPGHARSHSHAPSPCPGKLPTLACDWNRRHTTRTLSSSFPAARARALLRRTAPRTTSPSPAFPSANHRPPPASRPRTPSARRPAALLPARLPPVNGEAKAPPTRGPNRHPTAAWFLAPHLRQRRAPPPGVEVTSAAAAAVVRRAFLDAADGGRPPTAPSRPRSSTAPPPSYKWISTTPLGAGGGRATAFLLETRGDVAAFGRLRRTNAVRAGGAHLLPPSARRRSCPCALSSTAGGAYIAHPLLEELPAR